MIYEYKSKKTGKLFEKEFSMKENIPDRLEENNDILIRVFSSATHIPFQWGATRNRPDFSKSPSGKKHFY